MDNFRSFWPVFNGWISKYIWLYLFNVRSPIQLLTPVIVNNYVSAAPLPLQGDDIAEGSVCRVSGWGFTSPTGDIPSALHTATVPIVSSARCNSTDSYNGNITENMICAGYADGGTDACSVSYTLCHAFK